MGGEAVGLTVASEVHGKLCVYFTSLPTLVWGEMLVWHFLTNLVFESSSNFSGILGVLHPTVVVRLRKSFIAFSSSARAKGYIAKLGHNGRDQRSGGLGPMGRLDILI